jgi:serine/threonine-protein kinase
MGTVYEAVDDSLGRTVALKTLPELGPTEAMQLRTEARTMAALQHPGLAFVLGLETYGPLPVLVVEYLSGGTLANKLLHGPLTSSRVIELGISLADALIYLHEMGLLHRDIKPSNVGFTSSGRVKLLDFGVALPISLAMTSGAAGTMLYMPPEAFSGAPPSQMFDLWGVGVLLCEAWLGQHPLTGLRPAEQMRSLETGDIWTRVVDRLPAESSDLLSVLSTALSAEIPQRYASAQALRSSLARLR